MEAAAASGGKVSLTVTDITDEGTVKAALEAFADVYRTELRAWAPSSSRMVDAAWRAMWRVRRRPAVSDQSMWRVYSAKVTRTSLAGLRGAG